MSSTALAHQNGTKPHQPSWSTLTVQEFFRAVNWEDNPPEVQEIKLNLSQGEQTELSMMLTVSQFFDAVNWEGTAIAAAPSTSPVLELPPAKPAMDFTLDDFSDLF